MKGFVEVKNLRKLYPLKRGIFSALFSRGKEQFVHAVDDVSFVINKGEILGLAGESGCGKTTTSNLIAMLEEPTSGKIIIDGVDVEKASRSEKKDLRNRIGVVFQDPFTTFDPRMNIFDCVCEPLDLRRMGSRREKNERVYSALKNVELDPPEIYIYKYPHELSGGQRQRVAIARATILSPELLIADEPVSMLDVSVRTEIMNLLLKLRKDMNISCLFITHDISVVRYMCDKFAVMYLGRVMEMGSTEEIISNPQHPYTKILLKAVPVPDPRYSRKKLRIKGEVPKAIEIPEGCRFHPRCPVAGGKCGTIEPKLIELKNGVLVACNKINK